MAFLKIFTQPACPRCPAAKVLGEKLAAAGWEVEYYDVSEVDGMAEANMYMLQTTPSLVLVNNDEDELAVWRGEVPTIETIEATLKDVVVD